jgi:hypothetical protein
MRKVHTRRSGMERSSAGNTGLETRGQFTRPEGVLVSGIPLKPEFLPESKPGYHGGHAGNTRMLYPKLQIDQQSPINRILLALTGSPLNSLEIRMG